MTTTGGLRRFTRPAADPPPVPLPAAGSEATALTGPRCELCAMDIAERHGHVVALDDRSLRCACRPCWLLFAPEGAGAGRFRAVPERYLTDPGRALADDDWALLQVPVTTAFFFVNSDLDRVVGCYPSPAGATECLLDLAGWQQLSQAYPLLRAAEPDVEAVFVTRTGDGLQAFLLPIDACYSVVGQLRLSWRGLDGGDEARRALGSFVEDLRRRSRPLPSRKA